MGLGISNKMVKPLQRRIIADFCYSTDWAKENDEYGKIKYAIIRNDFRN